MKQKLKMTLFKKIFLMAMVGFIIVLLSFTYLLFQSEKRFVRSRIYDSFEDYHTIHSFQNELKISDNSEEKYDYASALKKVKDNQFINKMKEHVRIALGDVAIIRRNYKDMYDLDQKNEIIVSTFDNEEDYIKIKNQKYSLEKLTNEQKESLLKYLEKHMNDIDQQYNHTMYLEYNIKNNQISYLSWGQESYGQKETVVQRTYINDFRILNKIVYINATNGQFQSVDTNDIKEAISLLDYYIEGNDWYSLRELEVNHQTFFIALGYVGGDYNLFDETTNDKDFLNIINIQIADHYNEYVLHNCLVEYWWVYVITLIVLIIISWCLSTVITYPISKIQKSAEKIAQQDFDEKVDIKSNDEIGSLAKSIDTMRIQLKDTIKQLNQEIDHVKELETMRKDFINQFTHEMKTPLSIINGYSELIEETENDQEKEKYLNIINRETTKINKLIQTMLSLSRLEAGKVELHKEELDLEDLITEVVDEYAILLMKKKAKVKIEVKNEKIKADRKQIMIVIQNIMSNAIKHVKEEGKIVIEINQGVSIYNEGERIAKEKLESIWYTFVTHDKDGSGLGLAICRSILELHQFEYGVRNKEEGVMFYFYSKSQD